MLVRAINRGYFGNSIRDPGAEFEVSDDVMADAKRRPRWVEPADGSKLDEENEGKKAKADTGAAGGSSAATGSPGGLPPGSPPAAAKAAKGRGKKAKADTDRADSDGAGVTQLPPQTVPDGTGVTEGLGGQAPDWLPSQADQT